MGNIYRQQQDLQRADAIYSQAESILKRAGDPSDLARVCHNLGMVYTGLRYWNDGEACFERAIELWQNQSDMRNLANTWGEFSCLYFAWGRHDQARACLDKAWHLVSDRPEAHYVSLRRELAERRSKLDNS